MTPSLIRRIALIVSLLALQTGFRAHAGEHGGGGGGLAPLSFVVNLMSTARSDRVAKIDFALETASPDIEPAIKAVLPRIQHRIILLLSGKNDETLLSTEGKHALAEEVRHAVNEILRENEKTGVKEILFTDFLIQ